ncbi:SagB/ThcOx family dehydrogenase [Nonomuraea sp. LPB2021202275-12-8]|uniref:SagB/ThcOx family dehydrogenase n=1 Tax=Nonomuraea sp. LPB2021202275-12-8 TaxID=3120159 RepID=UPI00300D5CAA
MRPLPSRPPRPERAGPGQVVAVPMTADEPGCTVEVCDELSVEYVLDTDLIVGGRGRRTHAVVREAARLDPECRPVLVPGTRLYLDESGAARLCLPLGEPVLDRHNAVTVLRRRRRDVLVRGDLRPLWETLRAADGHTPAGRFPAACGTLPGRLAAAGAFDLSGRPVARYLHTMTKKGVLPGDPLTSRALFHPPIRPPVPLPAPPPAESLSQPVSDTSRDTPSDEGAGSEGAVTSGGSVVPEAGAGTAEGSGASGGASEPFTDAAPAPPASGAQASAGAGTVRPAAVRARRGVAGRLPVSTGVPAPLASLHALTRSRRSVHDHDGPALRRAELDAILTTACGVTGTLRPQGHGVPLRAYPSSGGRYAIEVYPAVLAVDGLPSGVYRYDARASALDPVRAGEVRADVLGAALPKERATLGSAAALICLTGVFARHEDRHGEGGYRMLIAEAGHLSQNLVLAATALGVHARPVSGLFDDLVNRALGLEGEEEQFVLGVLLGHT